MWDYNSHGLFLFTISSGRTSIRHKQFLVHVPSTEQQFCFCLHYPTSFPTSVHVQHDAADATAPETPAIPRNRATHDGETRGRVDSAETGSNAAVAGAASSERERRATERPVAVWTAPREGAIQL